MFNATREFRKITTKEFIASNRTRKWIAKQFKNALKKYFKNAKSDDVRKVSLVMLSPDNYGYSKLQVKNSRQSAIIYECPADFEETIRSILLKWYTEDYLNEFSIKR